MAPVVRAVLQRGRARATGARPVRRSHTASGRRPDQRPGVFERRTPRGRHRQRQRRRRVGHPVWSVGQAGGTRRGRCARRVWRHQSRRGGDGTRQRVRAQPVNRPVARGRAAWPAGHRTVTGARRQRRRQRRCQRRRARLDERGRRPGGTAARGHPARAGRVSRLRLRHHAGLHRARHGDHHLGRAQAPRCAARHAAARATGEVGRLPCRRHRRVERATGGDVPVRRPPPRRRARGRRRRAAGRSRPVPTSSSPTASTTASPPTRFASATSSPSGWRSRRAAASRCSPRTTATSRGCTSGA